VADAVRSCLPSRKAQTVFQTGLFKGRSELNLDIAAVAELWRQGSVVRSWLLDLMAGALKRNAVSKK